MACTRLIVCVLLAGLPQGCTPPPTEGVRQPSPSMGSVTATPAPPPGQARALQELRNLAARLNRLAPNAKDTASVGDLPVWVHLDSWNRGTAAVPPDPDALRAITKSDESPQIRALALLWLASARRLDDLDVIESAMTSNAPAGQYPSVHITQQARASYPVSWAPLSMAGVALAAAGKILGMDFQTAEDYRRWRREHGDLGRSYAYWVAILTHTTHGEPLDQKLGELRRVDPTLFLRVALMGDTTHFGLSAQEIATAARTTLGAKKILALLRRQEQWPEFENTELFSRFASYVYSHWKTLLGPEQAGELLNLWSQEQYEDVKWVRRELAIAAAQANPTEGRRILREALTQRPAERMGAVLYEIASSHPETEYALLSKWFLATESSDLADHQVAVIQGLEGQSNRGRKVLRKLVLDRRFKTDDATVIAALGKAVRRLGGEIDPRCAERGHLRERFGKGYQPTAQDKRESSQARRRCLRAEKTWLRSKR